MSNGEFDARLDARLRDVSVPIGLTERLHALAETCVPPAEDPLDAALRDVPVPVGLARRLSVVALASDEDLDAALRDVRAPVQWVARLDRTTRRATAADRLLDLATAGSLWLAVAVGYLGFATLLLWTLIPMPRSSLPTLETSLAVSDLSATWTASEKVTAIEFDWAVDRPKSSMLLTVQEAPAPEVELDPVARREISAVQSVNALTSLAGVSLLDDVHGGGWEGVIGSHDPFDLLGDLRRVPGLRPRGLNFPLTAGYDIQWLSVTGFHPMVTPAADPRLCCVEVPLEIEPRSFDLLQAYTAEAHLPPASSLRTEEMLAAVDFEYPRPSGKKPFSLFASGGPAIIRPEGTQLLQVGIQAREIPLPDRRPTHLTLCIDTSASMAWGGRLETLCEALTELPDWLDEEDRVSVVMFAGDAYVLGEDLSRLNPGSFADAARALRAEGTTNLGEGLRQAFAAALRRAGRDGRTHRLILLTDGQAELDTASVALVAERIARAAEAGVRFEVIDLSQDRQTDEVDPQLIGLAEAGGGQLRRASAVGDVRRAIEEILTGRSRLVGRDVRLTVVFNPESVTAYRLIGHEPRAVIGLTPVELGADFSSGQSATTMFEVRLTAKGSPEVARLELRWMDPVDGSERTLEQSVGRGRFVSPLSSAPLALQAGSVVTAASAVLRGSPFSQVLIEPEALGNVLRVARQLDGRLWEEHDISRMLLVLEEAARIETDLARRRGR